MIQDQPFILKRSLGGPVSWVGPSLGDFQGGLNGVGHLMESQIWHELAGSVGGRLIKGTVVSACLDARHFSFSLMLVVPFKLLPWC